MASTVTNFSLYSQTFTDNVLTLTFSFDLLNDITVGGYKLLKSVDDTGHNTTAQIRPDVQANQESSISTRNDETVSKTYFDYEVSSEDLGRRIFFSLVTIATDWSETAPTSELEVFTSLVSPSSFITSFDNFHCILSWDPVEIDTSLGSGRGTNSIFSSYAIYRGEMDVPTGLSINTDTGALTSDDFLVGSYVWVIDKVKRSMWFGQVLTPGFFLATTDNRVSGVFDASDDYVAKFRNLDVFMFASNLAPELIGVTTDAEFTDTTCIRDRIYIYFVSCKGVGNVESDRVGFPIITQDMTKRMPYLRSVDNSSSQYLQQSFWRLLKDVLIDKNYYNKSKFAIPYLRGSYTFRGYIGISSAKVDIYLNSIYNQTVISDSYGGFEFNIQLSLSDNLIQIQARDKLNQGFSMKSTRQIVTVVNMYSFFAALGAEYQEIWTEILQQKTDLSFRDSRYLAFEGKITPLINFYKDISEDDEAFRNIAIAAYIAYEYAGYKAALTLILDTFQNNITEFDHYGIYYNDSLYNTLRTGQTYAMVTSTGVDNGLGLSRGNYFYGVSSVSDTAEETTVQTVRVDTRWWPTSTGLESSTGYYGYNILWWPEVEGIQRYGIYREQGPESSTGSLNYMITIPGNVFADVGTLSETTTTHPKEYTLTSFDKPETINVRINTRIGLLEENNYKRNWLEIILYAVEDQEIPSFQLSRILSLFSELIPPELHYRVIYCNDSFSEFLVS